MAGCQCRGVQRCHSIIGAAGYSHACKMHTRDGTAHSAHTRTPMRLWRTAVPTTINQWSAAMSAAPLNLCVLNVDRAGLPAQAHRHSDITYPCKAMPDADPQRWIPTARVRVWVGGPLGGSDIACIVGGRAHGGRVRRRLIRGSLLQRVLEPRLRVVQLQVGVQVRLSRQCAARVLLRVCCYLRRASIGHPTLQALSRNEVAADEGAGLGNRLSRHVG